MLAIDLPKAIIALVGLYDMAREASLEKIPTSRLMKQPVHTCTMNVAFKIGHPIESPLFFADSGTGSNEQRGVCLDSRAVTSLFPKTYVCS